MASWDNRLTESVIYDGSVIPPDSILFHASGQHDGANNAATLSDSTASFGTDTYNSGFTARNTSDGSTAPITDTTNTTIVGTLTGGTENDWDTNDYYEVVVTIAANDKIYFTPTATGIDPKTFLYQLYDDSDGTFSELYEASISAGATWEGGDVSMSVKGVPTITESTTTGGNSGGYTSFWRDFDKTYDKYSLERRRKKKKEAEKIKDDLDRALALAERALEDEEVRQTELQRITEIAEKHHLVLVEMSPNLDRIIKEAVESQTYSRMERLEREIKRVKEEDDFIVEAMKILLV